MFTRRTDGFRRFRQRLSLAWAAISRLGSRSAAAVGQNVDEVVTAIALVLVTVALWPQVGRLSLLVPGVVLLWMALPARRPFVVRPDADKSSRRKE